MTCARILIFCISLSRRLRKFKTTENTTWNHCNDKTPRKECSRGYLKKKYIKLLREPCFLAVRRELANLTAT